MRVEWPTIIQRSGHTTRPDIVRVFRCPSNIDSVTVRVRKQSGNEDKCGPFLLNQTRPESEGDNAWKCPDGLKYTNQGALIQFFAYPGNTEEGDDVEDIRRDGEQIGIELLDS